MLRVIVTNPADLVRQRGALAGVAAQLAPELARQAVDVEIARQLRAQLKAQGVQAEVIIEPNPAEPGSVSRRHWILRAVIALLLVASGAGLALLGT